MRASRVAATALPLLLATTRVRRDDPAPAPAPPVMHATDVWLGHAEAAGGPPAPLREQAERERLRRLDLGAPGPKPQRLALILGEGFRTVGSVAVMEADPDAGEISPAGPLFGMTYDNLWAVSRRFLAAYGDHFDQIAMFLEFTDKFYPQALAYEMPVANQITGLGLEQRDDSARFGSPSGRLKAFLNMKRILAYGRDSADQPQNSLYAVWAQEAAHRWLVYFKTQPAGATAPLDELLGRAGVHWSSLVQTDASLMDGILWRDNGDGTFTPLERMKRYGALDQYAMGLRSRDEVPPFFVLEDVKDAAGRPVGNLGPLNPGTLYTATRVDRTVDDIIAAMGPRNPPTDASARDLRMGVVLVVPPGSTSDYAVGEAFRIDRTRALWDDFYDQAGGGRGKVCTTLLHPCRGDVLTFGQPKLSERVAAGPERDGTVAPGEAFTLALPVFSSGTDPAAGPVTLAPPDGVTLARDSASPGALAPGDSGILTFDGRVGADVPCGQPLRFDVSAPGDLGASQEQAEVVIGLLRRSFEDFEGDAAGWRVDPDGTDTATSGRWQVATPERTSAFDFITQPAGAYSGSRALVTGAAAGTDASDFDVDDGHTTVESPPLAIGGLREPRLRYRAYFVSADFLKEVLVPGADDDLRVQVSANGRTWTEVDRLTGLGLGWQDRIVKLSSVLDAGQLSAAALRVRFVAEDVGAAQNVVEAVIDDVEIDEEAPSCEPSGPAGAEPASDAGARQADGGGGEAPGGGHGSKGCGCRLGEGGGAPPHAAALAAVLALARRGRSRRRTRGDAR